MLRTRGAMRTALFALVFPSYAALRTFRKLPLNLTDGTPKEFNFTRIPQLNFTMAGLDAAVTEGCPVCGHPEQVGTLTPSIKESSGLVKSRRRGSIWYTINDSPAEPVVFAIRETGELVQTIRISDVETDQQFGETGWGDWEDVAVGPCVRGDSRSCIFVADIGHNCARTQDCHFSRRIQSIIRFPEPVGDDEKVAVRGERLWWRYPETAGQYDAESFVVTQAGDMFVVTKEHQDVSIVFSLPDPRPGFTVTARPVLEVRTPDDSSTMFTGADVQESGGQIAGVTLRTYTHVLHFPARRGEDVVQAMQKQPCVLPSPVMRQSEALGWDKPDGDFYLVTTEGAGSPIMKVRCSAAPPAMAQAGREQMNNSWVDDVNITSGLSEVNGTESTTDRNSRS